MLKKAAIALVVCSLCVSLKGATTGFMTVVAAKQGTFKGEVTAAGHKDAIAVMKIDFEIEAPHDAATGLSSGRRVHKPIVITKEIDGTSPLFLQALSNNEVLKNVNIELVRANARGAGMAGGTEVTYYSIKLTNASVTSLREFTEESNGTAETIEEISLTYEKVEVNSPSAKTTAQDTWQTGR